MTTLLLLPMMLSPAVVGLFWKLLYDPSWGVINFVLGLGKFAWLSNPDLALYAVAITDIWMWAPFVMLLSLAGLSRCRNTSTRRRRSTGPAAGTPSRRITLPLVAPCCSSPSSSAPWRRSRLDIAYIMSTQPTTELISIKLYKLAFQEWQTGKSWALAYIVLIMVLAITNIYVKYLNRVKER